MGVAPDKLAISIVVRPSGKRRFTARDAFAGDSGNATRHPTIDMTNVRKRLAILCMAFRQFGKSSARALGLLQNCNLPEHNEANYQRSSAASLVVQIGQR